MINLRIVTPKKIVRSLEVSSVTAPSADGEITILPQHGPLLALLVEGIVTYRSGAVEESLSIGGGYLQTDGKVLQILVSRAYGQDEIDEKLTQEAITRAQDLLKSAPDATNRVEAQSLLRRSIIDSKLLKRRAHRTL
ncbi:MAG: ATP synthase F1 subunit epsilon [Candidatus Roizmanbacteria bacterium]